MDLIGMTTKGTGRDDLIQPAYPERHDCLVFTPHSLLYPYLPLKCA